MNIAQFPKYIMIQTSSRCNAACTFCPYPSVKDSLEHTKMELPLFKKIVEECGNYPQVERIMPYLMNEPLMDSQLEDKIDYTKEKNPKAWVHFLSNGALLSPQRSKRILESTLDQICFSVHSVNKQIYETTMGIDFEKTIKNITDFIHLAREKNKAQNYIMITFFKWQELDEEKKQKAITFWQQQGISQINVFDGPISRAGNVPNIKGPHKEQITKCNSIWADEMMHILSNGEVVPCCMDWKRENVLGNVKEASLLDIWHSPPYQNFRNQLTGITKTPNNFLCKRCEASA